MLSAQEIGNAIGVFRHIAEACDDSGIHFHSIPFPWLVLGVGSRETGWGTSRFYKDVDGVEDADPGDGTGDHGHGRGLMQIDDRWHQEFIASGDWKDPRLNVRYAVLNVLKLNHNWLFSKFPASDEEFRIRMMLSSYNCGAGNVRKAVRAGLDPDFYTTGKDYAFDVLRRAEEWRAMFTHGNLLKLVPRPLEPLTKP